MKKLIGLFLSLLTAAFFTSCNDIQGNINSEETGSITIVQDRYLDVTDIKKADVNVYSYGKSTVTVTDVAISGGKGSAVVDGIPCGKNRVVEVIGYKAGGVKGKTIYCAIDVNPGDNTASVAEGAKSAKGKAYLALINAGVDVTSVSLSGFNSSSSYLFDAEGFAAAYKADSSVTPSSFYKTAGTVILSNIKNAKGYTVSLDDPLSEVVTIADNATTTSSITNVAPGKWNVYVNDGNGAKKSGSVTLSGASATYDTMIGNSLSGKCYIFVKSGSAPTIWAWEAEGVSICEKKGLTWDTQETMKAVEPGMMNDPTGWFYYDVSDYASGKQISFILNKGSTLTDAKCTKTFWYDGSAFYDSDPTTPVLPDDDTSLKDIKVNGVSIGTVKTYSVPYATSSVTVTAEANSEKATVKVSPSAETQLTVGNPSVFTVTVTAETGDKANYTLSVTREAKIANDVTITGISVNGSSASGSGSSYTFKKSGSDETLAITSVKATPTDPDAKVSYSTIPSSVADGKPASVTVTVTNGTGKATYTLTIDYTYQESAAYYWTNKNGYGANKTISSWSDWTEDMKIAQGAVNDDPRVFCHWSMHENPNDAYAMFAAYDSKNLYLMVELPNVQDIVAPGENYPMSDNGQYWNRGTPFFFAFDTGKGPSGDGSMANGSYVWDSQVQFSEANVNRMIVCHSLPSKGTPGVFIPDSTGKFSYAASNCLTWAATGVSVTYDGGAHQPQGLISKNLFGIKAVGTDQGRDIANIATDPYVDFYSAAIGHKPEYDLKWQITIPLSVLDVDEAYLKSHGIGVMFVLSDGGSGMDCLPWDPSMADNAATPYSKDESSSAEKEDLDVITVPFARVGK